MYTISFDFLDRLQRQNFQGSMASSGGESGDGGVNDCSIDSRASAGPCSNTEAKQTHRVGCEFLKYVWLWT